MRSCGSSARSCSHTRPGLRRVCGPQLASSRDGSAPFCIAPQPFFFRCGTAREAEARSAAAAAPAAAAGRARARARARGPAFAGFASRSSPLRPTAAHRSASPPNPSSSATARHARPNRARLPRPRHAQLRVERALALAHAARRSQVLRHAARLSPRRQRAALPSPLPLQGPPQHGEAEARSYLSIFFLTC